MKPSTMSFFHTLTLKADLSALKDPARFYSILFTYLYTAPLTVKTNQRRPPVRQAPGKRKDLRRRGVEESILVRSDIGLSPINEDNNNKMARDTKVKATISSS